MKRINEAWCIQIEVNNFCPHSCAYCTRLTRHLRPDQKYNMSPDQLKDILYQLDQSGYSGNVGLIGGEPTVHPSFREICHVVYAHWTQAGKWLALWTSGGKKYQQFKQLIDLSFSWVAFNDKSDPDCHHQQMTMASRDVVPDPELRAELIDNCWVQRIWCPSITPKGVFFCECAAAWDRLLDGPGGWPIDSDWLSYGPEEYKEQMWACQLCGMCVPMEAQGLDARERVSVSVDKMFEEHNVANRDYEICSDKVDREIYEARLPGWAPGEYTPGRAKGGA